MTFGTYKPVKAESAGTPSHSDRPFRPVSSGRRELRRALGLHVRDRGVSFLRNGGRVLSVKKTHVEVKAFFSFA